jgi:hypothetical protein
VKKIQTLSFLATLAIALGMISWGSALHAQNAPSDRQTQQPTSTSPPDATTPSQPPTPEMPPQSQQTPNADTPRSQQPSSQQPSTPPDETTPESGSKSNTSAGATAGATDSQTFSGTVAKQGDKYVLKDDTGQVYDIDHQAEVAKFDGKRVRVQGTLDPSGKKILVK